MYGMPRAIASKTYAGITADQEAAVAASADLRLVGFAARESDGTPAVAAFNIVRGATVADGVIVVPVELAANESKTGWFWPGIDCATGITVDRVAGTVDVVLFFCHEPTV